VADTRISALTRLPEAGVSPTDLLPIADLSASETKAITAKDLLEGVVINMDAGSIPAAKIDFSSGVAAGNIQVSKGDVVLGRSSGSGFAEELACTAAGRALLAAADAAGQRTALGLGTLALRSGSWVDGSSFSGNSSGTNTGDQLIVLTGDVTGSGKGTFPATIAANAVTEAKLNTGAVSTRALADGSVTAPKLADQSACIVAAAAPGGAGAFLGQQALATNSGVAYTYTGAASGWVQHAGVQTIQFNEPVNTPLSFAVSGTSDATVSVTLDHQSANQVFAGPTLLGADAAPTFRALIGADLPAATTTTRGAVLPGIGVSVAGDALNIKPATSTVLGGVSVPGPSLGVDATGKLTHLASPLAAGTYVKVTTDSTGHVTAGQTQIGDADVAGISATKLTSGTLDMARVAANSIERTKLANYATTVIQETDPGKGDYVGQFWYRESDAQLRTWSNNSWIPVGFGRLSQENLRFCGTFNAATGQIINVTTYGTSAGLAINTPIPAATEALTGVYLVAVTPGVYNTETYDNGDWVLCLGASTGWKRVDTLSSAGGAATFKLDDLLDVAAATPQSGDSLVYDAASATWKNRTTHGQKISLIEPFDGLRSTFTTGRAIVSENNLMVSVGGVIQNPGVDFTAVAGSTQISFSTPPPPGSDYWILQEAAVDGGGGGGAGTSLPPGTSAEEYLKWNNTLSSWQPSDTINGGSF